MPEIMFPVGRMIGGSLEKLHPRTDDAGKPKLNSDATPMMVCNFGVAIPKTQADWRNEPWGQMMLGIGKAAEPVLHQSPSFAWKIINGDDNLPNKNGKVPNQQEGYAGHWVLWFSQGWLPKLCSADGAVELQPGAIVPGYFIQVLGDVASNGAKPPQTPGLYLNPRAVALAGVGDRIVSNDVNTQAAGFGGALPAGARPVEAAVPGFAAPVAPAIPAPVAPVVPNAAFMTPPAPPVAVPPAPPADPVLTAKAAGATYAQMIASGWNDDLLRAHGYMV